MHLVIYGPEGSGKGTQAHLISQKFGLPVYTSGDLVRETAENDKGSLGDSCRRALTEGVYVTDSDMFVLWQRKFETNEAKKGFILDGFPRNINQVNFLFEVLDKQGYSIDHVIYLTLSDEVSKERLSKRSRKLFEGSTINHDDPGRVAKRLETYRKNEKEVIEFFEKKNLLLTISGDKTIEEVFTEIVKRLEDK